MPAALFLRRFASLLALAVLLLAPQVVPQARAQQDVPALQDTLTTRGAGPAETITYEEAVRLALDRNYQLRRARNDVTLQSINVDRNRAEYYPDLALSVNSRRDYGRNFSQSQGTIVSQSSSEASFGASTQITLFDGFQRDATLDEAQARTQAAGRTLQRRRQDVIFQVLQRYIQLAQNRALVEVRREQLAFTQDQLSQTEAQIEVGEKAPSEVYQIQADVAAARQQLVQAQRDVEITQTELVRLLVLDPFGEYAFDTSVLEEQRATVEGAARQFRLADVLATAYEARADLSAQRAALAADEQGVRAARGGLWPRLALSGSYGSNWSSLSRRPIEGTEIAPDVVTVTPDGGGDPVRINVPGTGVPPQYERTGFLDQLDGRRGGGVTLSLSYPLFDRFQTQNQIEQARVQLENTRFAEEILRQDIAVEARQALVDYRNARIELEVAAERLQAARQAQEAAEERYRLGAATYVEVAEANASFVNARNARVRAQYSLLLQRRNLAYITGTLDPEAPLAE